MQAKLNDGVIVNIELQMRNYFNIEERTTLYSSKVISRETERGSSYNNINKVIMINILGYNLLEFNEYISDTVIVLNKHRDYEMLKGIKWYFIELPKFRKQNPDLNKKINQWLVFLDDSDQEAVKMAERKNNTLKKARKEIDYLTGDDAVRRLADLREKWEMDYVTGIECAEKRGIAKGLEKGINKGKNEGKKQKQIEIAQNLLKIGMKISEISEATGLTIEEIEQINKN